MPGTAWEKEISAVPGRTGDGHRRPRAGPSLHPFQQRLPSPPPKARREAKLTGPISVIRS